MKVIVTDEELELAKTNPANKASLAAFIIRAMRENTFCSLHVVENVGDELPLEDLDLPPEDWIDFQLINVPFKRPMDSVMQADITAKIKKMSISVQKRRIDPGGCTVALAPLTNDASRGMFILSFHDGKQLVEGFIGTYGVRATSLIQSCCSTKNDVLYELPRPYQSN